MNIRDKFPKKYSSLLDNEMWNFIEKTESWYPEEAISWPIEKTRENYNAMCAAFHPGRPADVISFDTKLNVAVNEPYQNPTVPQRYYVKGEEFSHDAMIEAQAVVLYLHGGGYVVGGLDSHDDVCAEICGRTGFPVCSVDYALAPEYKFPADIENATASHSMMCDVFENHARETPVNIIMVGDSAGANLAAASTHYLRHSEYKAAGQVLIYPGLASDLTGGTFDEHANAPLLSTAETEFYKSARVGGDLSLLSDPRACPLNDVDFTDLPPTVVFSAECDPLCGDGEAYCAKIAEAGGKAHWVHERGLVHGYLRARHSVKKANDSFDRIIDAISMLGRGEWHH